MDNNEEAIGYKINTRLEYMVFRNEIDGRYFYKVRLQRKNYDGTKQFAYKNLMFKKDVEIPDRTIIKIKKGFEDFRINPNDKYNAIWSVFVSDFEIVDNKDKEENDALSQYEKTVSQAYKSPYDFENSEEYISLESLDNDLD